MASVSSTHIASIMFNRSARRHAARATSLDQANLNLDGAAFDDIAGELEAAAIASIVSAYMATEAILNELFLEASLFYPGHLFPGTGMVVSQTLLNMWREGAERAELDRKCQIAAEIFRKQRIDFGAGVPQTFRVLKSLRDTLIHHKPLAITHGSPLHLSNDGLEMVLVKLFPPASIWEGKGVPFRWTGCLGAGCARWAYESSTAFQKEFFGHLGVGYPSHEAN